MSWGRTIQITSRGRTGELKHGSKYTDLTIASKLLLLHMPFDLSEFICRRTAMISDTLSGEKSQDLVQSGKILFGEKSPTKT